MPYNPETRTREWSALDKRYFEIMRQKNRNEIARLKRLSQEQEAVWRLNLQPYKIKIAQPGGNIWHFTIKAEKIASTLAMLHLWLKPEVGEQKR